MIITNFILFTIIYFYISNWFQINTFILHLSSPSKKIKIIQDKEIESLIKRKTGVNLKRIVVFNSNQCFGMMAGIPIRPELILSSKMLETLNKDELEWVLLHEAGHCKMWHVVKCGIAQIILFVLGIFLLLKFSIALPVSILLAILFSMMSIQFMRYFEREADYFSISNVDNPKGVITAQAKLLLVNRGSTRDDNSLSRKILHWNIMPSERIAMAQNRINSEK